jgi:hypothetical protein
MASTEIMPGNDLVRTAAYAQAVAGELFLSAFIARVVSLYDRHHESHSRTARRFRPLPMRSASGRTSRCPG